MILNSKSQAVDGITGIGVSAEVTCPALQSHDGGDGISAADPGAQISDGIPVTADELPASTPAIDPAPQHSDINDPNPVDAPAADSPRQPPDADLDTATPVTAAVTPIEVTASQEPSAEIAEPTENLPPTAVVNAGSGAVA